jgi:hypothetical protein
MLDQLADELDLSNPQDAAVYAVATAAFFGQLRLGEIIPTSKSPSSTSNLPRVSDLSTSSRSGSAPLLFLPSTKTTSTKGDTVVLPIQDECCQDPFIALQLHIQCSSLQPDHSLASYRDSKNDTVLLSKTTFLHRCNSIWSCHNHPRITGHCFRIGGTSHYLLSGVDPSVVKALGRWRSDAFLRYWRSLDILATLHISTVG